MLVFEGKSCTKGSGVLDIARNLFKKTANSSLAKKVINSATTKNLQKALDSEIGKELQKSVLTGVSKGSESVTQSAFEKLGIPVPIRKRKKRTKVTKGKKGKGEGIVLD